MAWIAVKKCDDFLSSAEQWIQSGDFDKIFKGIANLRKKGKIPRHYASYVASYARRAGDPVQGLKILYAHLSWEDFPLASTDHELLMELAFCLYFLGRSKDVKHILKVHPFLQDKEKYYFLQAGLEMQSWDYDKAIESLKKYQSFDLRPYDRLVADYNLISSQIHKEITDDLYQSYLTLHRQCQESDYKFLYSNILFLGAQISYNRDDRSAFESYWDEITKIIPENSSRREILFKKYEILFKAKVESTAYRELLPLTELAKKSYLFEVGRSCALEYCKGTADEKAIEALYNGTPNLFYKTEMEKIFPLMEVKSEKFPLTFSDYQNPAKEYELSTSGGHLDTFVRHLLADSFKFPTVFDIAQVVYPEDFFHPHYTEEKIDQLIQRAKVEFKRNKSGIILAKKNNLISYQVTHPLIIKKSI